MKQLKSVDLPLTEFVSTTIYPVGTIRLPINIREGWKSLRIEVLFVVVDAPTSTPLFLGGQPSNLIGL